MFVKNVKKVDLSLSIFLNALLDANAGIKLENPQAEDSQNWLPVFECKEVYQPGFLDLEKYRVKYQHAAILKHESTTSKSPPMTVLS